MSPTSVKTTVFAAAVILLLAGCSAPVPMEDKKDLRDRVILSRQLMETADHAAAVLDGVVTELYLEGADPHSIAMNARARLMVTDVVRAMALSPDPADGLVRMYVWAQLAEWACGNRQRINPDLMASDCARSYGRIRANIESVARRYMDEKTRQYLDALIARHKEANPNLVTIGLMRIDDIAQHDAAAATVLAESADSMFSPVTDAARELEQTRLLGERLMWLAARMPATLSNAAEGTTLFLLETKRVREGVAMIENTSASFGRVSATMDRLAAGHERVSENLGKLAEAVDAIDRRAASAGTLALVGAVGSLVALLATVVVGFRWVAKSIERSSGSAERR
jgi:hypothetical protein